ncbi:2,3-bisphosphoglycerate-independent phosphoglycerate mutase [soil metagenome]
MDGARPRPVVLLVLDGFGIGSDEAADAIAAADMPNWTALLSRWPHARLDASGPAVGLPEGQMGNSEVGHLNLGAGRPVLQDLPRIDAAIADGSFAQNPALLEAVARAAAPQRRLHLVGLVGPGGVHSVDRHAVAVAEMAGRAGARDVVVHALLDGRDTPPRSADLFLPDLERRLAEAHPRARIATVGGRYYGMDRDRRWGRTERAYRAIVEGRGLHAGTAEAALQEGYARGESDEFVEPTVVRGVDGTVREGDALVVFNFRADRARQLVHALTDGDDFTGFERGPRPLPVVVTMTGYEAGLPVRVAFPPLVVPSLAEHFSGLGWRQYHVAETEKYAHVTYFFNGGVEPSWPGEDRLLVPSPQVATYDRQPEMSARGVTDALIDAITGGKYDFIVANYANPDMVGHSGIWDATVTALEYVDECLGRVTEAVLGRRWRGGEGLPSESGGLLCITADHGKADRMRDARGDPVTAHSLNPVPLLLAGPGVAGRALGDGVLADVAPTLLELLGQGPLAGMTGRCLLVPSG